MGTPEGLWPKPELDFKDEISFYKSEFAKLKDELADVEFVVDELVTSPDQIAPLQGRLKEVDGILAIHFNIGMRPILDEIAKLEPFGEGNSEPVLAAYGLDVPSGVRRMGTGGRHMSFWVRQGDSGFRAVAFGMGELADELGRSRRCDLVFKPRLNRWRGRESIELEIRDI